MSIRTWKFALAVGLCALGVLVFLMLQLPNNEAGPPPPPSATYIDNADCVLPGCHQPINATYNQTKHSIAFPTVVGENATRCFPCHTTGMDAKPPIYPATGYNATTNSPTYLQNVTCQSCHGPGSAHLIAPFNQKLQSIALVMNSSLCGACHTSFVGSSHHPTYSEWKTSVHAEPGLPSYIKNNVQCANCHESWMAMKYIETGVFRTSYRTGVEDAPLTWEIGCPTCHDPHTVGIDGITQLRVPADEICQKCHNAFGATPASEPDGPPHHPMAEMRNNTAGFGVDRSQTSFMPTVSCFNCHMGTNNALLPNHTFMPNATACLICHDSSGIEPDLTSASQAQAIIDQVKERTDGQLTMGKPLLDDAIAIINQMAGNRTGENLTAWMEQYKISKFNLDSVDLDMSKGNHNPMLAERLLADSMDRSNKTIANLTPPDKITGVVATDMGSGSLKIEWTPSAVADFAKYRVYILSSKQANITANTWVTQLDDKSTTTFSVDGVKAGTYYVYVTAVDKNGNEITNTLTPTSVAMTGPQGLSGEVLGLLAGLIIVIVVAAGLAIMIMRRRQGPKPPETSEKKGQ